MWILWIFFLVNSLKKYYEEELKEDGLLTEGYTKNLEIALKKRYLAPDKRLTKSGMIERKQYGWWWFRLFNYIIHKQADNRKFYDACR